MSTSAWFERLSEPRPPTGTPVLFDRAVVMGGSVAGLMAGRVLADRAGEVIIVEFSGDAATGVRVEAGGAETVERADFVVDAMGRSSRLGDWLEQAGWQRAPMQRMTVDLNYASAVFRRDDEPPYTFVTPSCSTPTRRRRRRPARAPRSARSRATGGWCWSPATRTTGRGRPSRT